MVDATASFDGNRLAATEASPRALPRDQAGPSTSVVSAEGLAAYAEFCRTALFAPAQRRLYLAVPHRGAQRAEIRIYEARD